MNYHNILHDDMRNGEGLRVVLFVSGCNHRCDECHNPQTWDCKSGIEFDANALSEIKQRIANLKGNEISISVNRGRKKIDKLQGFIENIYPSVFTFLCDGKARETFSYFDVLCGLVAIENGE